MEFVEKGEEPAALITTTAIVRYNHQHRHLSRPPLLVTTTIASQIRLHQSRHHHQCLLKLLNFLMVVAGLGMIVYGIYLFVKYKRAPDDNSLKFNGDGQSYISFGRPMLRAVSLSSNVFDNLPKVYLLVHWVALFVISGGSLMKVLRL
ncbi:Uncharacterized protein Rs2_05591 [Raphanus sativus]|nr:Uncharacterized protein Rs2_05591 [Raphanus sativus]